MAVLINTKMIQRPSLKGLILYLLQNFDVCTETKRYSVRLTPFPRAKRGSCSDSKESGGGQQHQGRKSTAVVCYRIKKEEQIENKVQQKLQKYYIIHNWKIPLITS